MYYSCWGGKWRSRGGCAACMIDEVCAKGSYHNYSIQSFSRFQLNLCYAVHDLYEIAEWAAWGLRSYVLQWLVCSG